MLKDTCMYTVTQLHRYLYRVSDGVEERAVDRRREVASLAGIPRSTKGPNGNTTSYLKNKNKKILKVKAA